MELTLETKRFKHRVKGSENLGLYFYGYTFPFRSRSLGPFESCVKYVVSIPAAHGDGSRVEAWGTAFGFPQHL